MTLDSGTYSDHDLARQYFAMWNTGDTTAVSQILSANWNDHSHPEVSGPADVAAAVAKTRVARPELRFEIEAILAENERVCVIGGVGAPDAPGQIASRLIWLFQVSDGRLTDLWTYRAA
jgi:hypothetical protein